MNEVKKCPCGERPKELGLVPVQHGSKYWVVYGTCCGEWQIEFKVNYDEEADKRELALEAWNNASRKGMKDD